MEKVIEIYNNIKDRLSNPFVFSFICSWLVYNWRIPVALIWYDKSQFSGCGCHTIFDFISFELAKTNSFLFPLFLAFVYTISIPFIKNGVRIVSAYAQKWGENEEIKALDGGKIGVEKYLKLKDDYIKATKRLEETIEDEKKYLTLNTDLLNEINDVKSQLNDSLVERNNLNDKIRKINDYSFLNGKWIKAKEFIVANNLGKGKNINATVFRFFNGKCYLNDETENKLIITEFFNNVDNQKIMFQMQYIRNDDISKTEAYDVFNFVLKYDDSFSVLSGKLNENIIELTKQEV